MDILINTAAVTAAAERISSINREISDEMNSVDTALRNLQNSWQGAASTAAGYRYNQLKRSLGDSRYTVVNGLVSFMKVQVGEGYEIMENSVKAAAQAFK